MRLFRLARVRLLLAVVILVYSWGDAPRAIGQQPVLVKDINAQPSSANPSNVVVVGSVIYFAQGVTGQGSELWRSDGTAAGTFLVKDINPGTSSSSPASLINVNGMLFFTANDGVSGNELWKSDGTTAGTVRVKDINPGANGGQPGSFGSLVAVNSTLFFPADDGTNGFELWKSDGTAAGTVMVKNINPAATVGSFPQKLVNVNGTLFFSASDGSTGAELWKSDGTSAGTVRVMDIWPGSSSSNIDSMVNFNNTLYFKAWDGSNGEELWRSNGTSAVMVKDINSGSGSSSPAALTVAGGTLYFRATTFTNGIELYKSDGTSAGTVQVKDINPGVNDSTPSNLIDVGGKLFFSATDANGTELWKSDGTLAGTVMVKDILPGTGNAMPSPALASFNNLLFFAATDGVNGNELWRSDGTTAGTTMLADLAPGIGGSGPTGFVPFGSVLLFSASVPGGRQLLKTDGTAAGIKVISSNGITADSNPIRLFDHNGTLFFAATDGVNGFELWKTAGTGASLVKDIAPGNLGASISGLASLNGVLFFSATDTVNGQELWKSDGTEAGTFMLKNINPSGDSSPTSFTTINGVLYFWANNGVNGNELWKSDGTAAGTVMVRDITAGTASSQGGSFVEMNGIVYFSAGPSTDIELWRSDGTSGGTTRVKDIWVGSSNSGMSGSPTPVKINGKLLFFANDGTNGFELWTSDGTSGGTALVKDIFPGSSGGGSNRVIGVGNTLFFLGFDATNGRELWKSDGTTAGTVLLKDIFPGVSDSTPLDLIDAGGTLFFTAIDPVNGRELWKSDGTPAGTKVVKDINPGVADSSPATLVFAEGEVFFQATDGVNGFELWRSAGSAADTVMVEDLWVGTGNSNPTFMTPSGGALYFVASDGKYGSELWMLPPTYVAQEITVTTAAPASAAFASTFTVAATASSGLDVTITAEPSGVCSVASGGLNTATIQMNSGSGTCTVSYNQEGGGTFDPAPEVTSDTTATKVSPAVTFTGAPASALYLATFEVESTTASSASPLYSSSGACANTGTAYSMTSGSGACTSTVTWAADANYQAASLSQITNAARLDPAVTFTGAPASQAYLSTFTVASTTESTSAPLYSASGACSSAGDFVTMTSGTGTCTSSVIWAADANYNGAARSQTTSAVKATPAVSFTGAPASASYLGSFTVGSTTNGLMPPVYTSSGVCTNAGPVYTMSSGTGACTSIATWAADVNYTGATLSQTTTAQKIAATVVVSGFSGSYDSKAHGASGSATGANSADLSASLNLGATFSDVPGGTAHWTFNGGSNYVDQSGDAAIVLTQVASTVVVTCPASVSYNAAAQTPCSASATGAGGLNQVLSVSYSNNVSAGTATANASYAGDTNHAAGADSATFAIAKADATVVVNAHTGVYDGYAHGASGTASGIGGVDLSAGLNLGASFNTVPGGTAHWTFSGGTNYNDRSGDAAIVISAAASAVTVTCPANVTYNGAAQTPCTANVSGAAGLNQALAVSYSANTNAGTATANSSYAGDGNHAAGAGSATFAIGKADAIVLVNGHTGVYDGNSYGASGTAAGVGGVDLSAGLNLGASFSSVPGGSAHWTFSGGTNYNDRSGDVLIALSAASSTVVVTCSPNVTYSGAAQTPCSASATGAGGLNQAPSVSYSDNISAGTATANASYAGDANHAPGSGSATFAIGKADAAVVVNGYSGVYDGSAHGASGVATGVGGVDLSPGLNLGASFSNVPGGTAHWTFSGGTNYSDRSGDAAVVLSAAPSTVAVICPASVPYTSAAQMPCSATVTGAGGLSQALIVSYSDNVNAGTATATASFAAAGNNAAASGSATFSIGKADAQVAVTGLTGPYDGAPHGATGTATGVGGIDLSGSLQLGASFTNAPGGTAYWTFSGGTNYNDAAGNAAIVIGAAPSTVTVTCPAAAVTYTGAAQTPCSAVVAGAGGLNQPLAVSYAANVNAGAASANASYAGDGNHAPGGGASGFTIAKAGQTIAFGALPNRTLGDAPFTVSAAGNPSGNPITFTTTTPVVCGSSGPNGSTITLVSAGTCSVRALLAGNTNYDAAPDVIQSFTVQAGASTTFSGLFSPWAPPGPGTYNGQTYGAGTVFKLNSTLPVKWSYASGGALVDSSRPVAQYPVLNVFGPLAQCGELDGTGNDSVVSYSGPGNTTVTYDTATKTWQRNVKLDGSFQGDKCYLLQVFDPLTNTTSPSFPIKTKK